MARLLIILSQLYIIFAQLLKAQSESSYAVHTCSNTTTYSPKSTYGSDLRTLLTTLSNSSTTLFGNASTHTREKIEALYQCRNDISLEECKSCVSNATGLVLQICPIEKTADIWYDKCLLRFSNETIVSLLSLSPLWYLTNNNNVSESERALFTGFVRSDLNDCATEAANSPSKFAVRERNTNYNLSVTDRIYTLVQCTADLSNDDCSQCLHDLVGTFPSCCVPAIGARVFNPSCSFRYETSSFYDVSGITQTTAPSPSPLPSPVISFNSSATGSPTSGKSGLSKAAIISIACSIGFFTVIFCIGCFVFIWHRRNESHSFSVLDAKTAVMGKESLMFDLSTLKAATNDFSSQNLVGHGGYGDVFMGTLQNGQEIAVKRLVENSSQGDTEFKNEVSLVANLQHKNLTRLLGFCLEGEERILIYEYVPNKSLDLFLFQKESGDALEWTKRYKIIEGIARGMLYLHEDSRLKIIHRDLKASNILLDGYLNPKISDFGMARIFGVEDTRVFTHRVVGTYGYMAPEYAMHGQFSAKSDVYSFGVLVLEVITGLKATEFYSNDDGGYRDLIGFVWKHWLDKRIEEVVDKGVGESYAKQEVLRCVHVALLCVEESPLDRPTMATVVLMLNSESTSVALPKHPYNTCEFMSRASSVNTDITSVNAPR